MGQPAPDVDAQQVQDDQEQRNARDPAGDLDQASLPRRVAKRAHRIDDRAGGDRHGHRAISRTAEAATERAPSISGAASGQGVAGARVRERGLQLALRVEPLEVRERRLDLSSHRRERSRHRRGSSERAAHAGGTFDGALDRGDVLLQVRRERVERVLRLLPGRGVGFAEPLQVGGERLRRRLRVSGGRLQSALRRIALDGVGRRRDRGLPGRDRRADAARPGLGGGGTCRRSAPPLEPQPAARNASDAPTATKVRMGFMVCPFSAR